MFEVDATDGEGPGADPAGSAPDFNLAPTKQAPVVVVRRPRPPAGDLPAPDDPAAVAADEEGDATADAAVEAAAAAPAGAAEPVRWLRRFSWGLVPSWAKERSIGARMINARAETLLERPAYRRAAVSRRCLVPADGWYEWQPSPTERDARGRPRKQPFFMHPIAPGPIAFAGVFEFWRDPQRLPDEPQAWLTSYAIITTAAEPGLDAIHDRMPLVLPRDRWNAWLDPDLRDPDAVRALMLPVVAGRFAAVPVSTRVNAVGNNGPELIVPLPADQLRGVVDPATGELLGAGDAPLF